MDLNGLKILNTRPARQAETLNESIKKAGGISIAIPALEIVSTQSWLEIFKKINLHTVHYAIFTSPNAVEFFAKKFPSYKLPSTIKTIAIGKGTANALTFFQIPVTYIPEKANSEYLLKLPDLNDVQDKTILLIKGEGGRDLIPMTLNNRGGKVITLDVYKRIIPAIDPDKITTLWQNNGVDIILCTSQQAISNLFTLFGKEGHTWLCNKPWVLISERLMQAAYTVGIKKPLLADYDHIIEAIAKFNNQGLLHGES